MEEEDLLEVQESNSPLRKNEESESNEKYRKTPERLKNERLQTERMSPVSLQENHIIDANSNDVISLPKDRFTGRQLSDSVSFNKRFLICTNVWFVIVLSLFIVMFSAIQIALLVNNDKISESVRQAFINMFTNIIVFVMGVFLPGPFQNLKLRNTKRKKD